jgi:hypothetical protein
MLKIHQSIFFHAVFSNICEILIFGDHVTHDIKRYEVGNASQKQLNNKVSLILFPGGKTCVAMSCIIMQTITIGTFELLPNIAYVREILL